MTQAFCRCACSLPTSESLMRMKQQASLLENRVLLGPRTAPPECPTGVPPRPREKRHTVRCPCYLSISLHWLQMLPASPQYASQIPAFCLPTLSPSRSYLAEVLGAATEDPMEHSLTCWLVPPSPLHDVQIHVPIHTKYFVHARNRRISSVGATGSSTQLLPEFQTLAAAVRGSAARSSSSGTLDCIHVNLHRNAHTTEGRWIKPVLSHC